MSNKPQAVSVTIMGKEYRISCDDDEQEDLVYSAHQLNIQMCKMRDSGKITGSDRIAVMAALNLAHELQVLKNQNSILSETLDKCLTKLSHKIENVLDNF